MMKSTLGLLKMVIRKLLIFFNIKNLFNGEHTDLLRTTNLALRAHQRFNLNKDYVIVDNKKKLNYLTNKMVVS